MKHYKIKDIDSLLHRLNKKQLTTEQLCQFFNIPITEMFRDPSFWRTFIKLLETNFLTTSSIRILLPGGIGGNNELFSLLILLKELQIKNKIKITVTNPFPIKNNSLSGILNKQEFELSKANFNRLEIHNIDFTSHFEQDYIGNYKFKNFEYYMQHIQNINHDFMTKEMPQKQDIIFFRNQLLYFSVPQNEIILSNLTKTLKHSGWLFLGVQERINKPEHFGLTLINEREQIYQKK
jgi:chemotaxis protein methyltransferase CheR